MNWNVFRFLIAMVAMVAVSMYGFNLLNVIIIAVAFVANEYIQYLKG